MFPSQKRLGAVAVLGGLLAGAAIGAAAPAEAGGCALPREHAALVTKTLQSELMVAALRCEQHDRYNAFVRRFKDELVARGGALRTYYERTHGGRAEAPLNALITRLANQASRRSLRREGAYCAAASGLFADLGRIEPADLAAFAGRQPFADGHGVERCATEAAEAKIKD